MRVVTSGQDQTAASCWCCGREYSERELVRLGAHPEVGICFGCALDIKQRASQREDELRPSPAAGLRTAVRGLREWVIARDWHNRPIIGNLLRRLNRHLP